LTNKSVIGHTKVEGAEPVSPDRLVEHALFKDVAWPFLRWNQGAIVERRFRDGDVICREGDAGSTAFVMIAGRFEVRINAPISYVRNEKKSGMFGSLVSLLTRPGKEEPGEGPWRRSISIDASVSLDYNNPVAVLTPEQDVIFGEMTCMNHYPRSATVTAKGDCIVWEIRRNVLYMLQRNKVSKEILDRVYRDRSLNSQLRSVELFAAALNENQFKQVVQFLQNV
jgi:CRP-like cAMP-binding protein